MIVLDNAIKDEDLLDVLTDPILWEDLCNNSYDRLLVDPHQKVITGLWNTVSMILYRTKELDLERHNPIELEYWCNGLDQFNTLGWHQDKREDLFPKKLITPKIGVVWYGHPHTVWGGYLEIQNEHEYEVEIERIEPVYNRAIVFDASKVHRVSQIKAGTRYGFQLNLW